MSVKCVITVKGLHPFAHTAYISCQWRGARYTFFNLWRRAVLAGACLVSRRLCPCPNIQISKPITSHPHRVVQGVHLECVHSLFSMTHFDSVKRMSRTTYTLLGCVAGVVGEGYMS